MKISKFTKYEDFSLYETKAKKIIKSLILFKIIRRMKMYRFNTFKHGERNFYFRFIYLFL